MRVRHHCVLAFYLNNDFLVRARGKSIYFLFARKQFQFPNKKEREREKQIDGWNCCNWKFSSSSRSLKFLLLLRSLFNAISFHIRQTLTFHIKVFRGEIWNVDEWVQLWVEKIFTFHRLATFHYIIWNKFLRGVIHKALFPLR